MKLETKYTEVHGQLGEKTIQSTISQAKLGKLWDMLQNPYKNNIGSIVREITSNCFDSHREAQISDAVRVKFSKDDSGFYISFIDVGVGMSPERVENIYSTYLESTKEESNDYIGMFGIGSKSPLSYQDLFYINTRFDGIEYNYIMRKGEMGPAIDLLMSNATTERNGTEIKIQIKSEYDVRRFLEESFEQLHYFNNVVIDVDDLIKLYDGIYHSSYSVSGEILIKAKRLQKDYNLVEGKHFIYRTNTLFSELHLSIGGVYYPIDWHNLSEFRIDLPIALKFDIGELSVIQTREDVRYTDVVIAKIKERIELLRKELVDIYNTKVQEEIEFNEFLEYDLSSVSISLSTNSSINCSNFLKSCIDKLNPVKVKDFPIVFENRIHSEQVQDVLFRNFDDSIRDYILPDVKIVKKFTSAGNLSSGLAKIPYDFKMHNFPNSFRNIIARLDGFSQNKKTLFILTKDQNYSVKKNRYLFNKLYPNNYPENAYIVTYNPRKKSYKKSKHLIKFLNLYISKSDIKALLPFITKKLVILKNQILKVNYDAIKVDEAWYKEYQKENRNSPVEYDRTELKFEKMKYTGDWDRGYKMSLEGFLKGNAIKILLSKEEQDELCSKNTEYSNTPLEKLFKYLENVYSQHHTREFILWSTANRNYKKVLDAREDRHRIYTLEEFLNDSKMQHKVLGKLATTLKVNDLIDKFNKFSNGLKFNELKHVFGLMNTDLSNDYTEALEYLNLNNTYSRTYNHFTSSELEELMNSFDALNNGNMLYDTDFINKVNTLVEFAHESQASLVRSDSKELFMFLNTYKPSKFEFRFNNVFYKQFTSEEDVITTFYPDADEESIKRYLNNKDLLNYIYISKYTTNADEVKNNMYFCLYRFRIKNTIFKLSLQDVELQPKVKEVEEELEITV